MAQSGWDLNCQSLALSDQRRTVNTNNILVHSKVKIALKDYITMIVAQQIEFNCTFLRPFLIRYMRKFPTHADALFNPQETQRKFKKSHSWIRLLLKELNMSYRAVTNDAGKLPGNWAEEKDMFLKRAA